VRRLKSISRKFVEEIQEEEKEMKKLDLEHVADSLKSHIKKFSNETSQKLTKIEGLVEGTPATRSIAPTNANNNSTSVDNNMQSQFAEMNRNMAALKESLKTGPASKPLSSFALPLLKKMITISFEEGVNKEQAQRAVREFGPLAAFIQTISNTEQQWDVQEIIIHSIDANPSSGAILFVRFSTKMGCWEGDRR